MRPGFTHPGSFLSARSVTVDSNKWKIWSFSWTGGIRTNGDCLQSPLVISAKATGLAEKSFGEFRHKTNGNSCIWSPANPDKAGSDLENLSFLFLLQIFDFRDMRVGHVLHLLQRILLFVLGDLLVLQISL